MLDQLAPRETLYPESLNELSRSVADCDNDKTPIIPWGGGSQQHLGNTPRVKSGEFVVVDMRKLNRVVEYSPDDLMLTVEGGITVGALQGILHQRGQFLPLDVPSPRRATVGGSLAIGRNAMHRFRYGPPRDFVLGMQVVNADGAITKAGARTVKNVAGYELHKLYIGSLGTLAIIAQATFKVFPRPNATTTLVIALDQTEIQTSLQEIRNLPNPPSALALLTENLAARFGLQASKGWMIFVRFAGAEKTVMHARTQVPFDVLIDDDDALWNSATDIPETLRAAHPTGVLLHIVSRFSDLTSLISNLQLLTTTYELPEFELFGYPSTCELFVAFSSDATRSREFVKRLRAAVSKLHAHVTVEHSPPEIKSALDIWGQPGPSFKLMRALKNQFDPNQILNPGRYVGGI